MTEELDSGGRLSAEALEKIRQTAAKAHEESADLLKASRMERAKAKAERVQRETQMQDEVSEAISKWEVPVGTKEN